MEETQLSNQTSKPAAQEQTPATPPVRTPLTPQSEKKEKPALRFPINIKTLFLFGGIILSLLLIGGSGFFLGGQYAVNNLPTPTPTATITPTVTNTPTPTTFLPIDAGIPIEADTVSFTRSNGNVYLRYKDHIYSEESANKNDYTLTKLSNPDAYQWYGLINAPQIPASAVDLDELFDFKIMPNKSNFIFIMRWPRSKTIIDYKVFSYDAYASGNKVTNLFNKINNTKDKNYNIPRLYKISNNNKDVAFNMYSCWNCETSQPEVMLFNIDTKQTKTIGKVSYFSWRTKNDYEYKEYIVIPCQFKGPGECFKDPGELPFITGTF